MTGYDELENVKGRITALKQQYTSGLGTPEEFYSDIAGLLTAAGEALEAGDLYIATKGIPNGPNIVEPVEVSIILQALGDIRIIWERVSRKGS